MPPQKKCVSCQTWRRRPYSDMVWLARSLTALTPIPFFQNSRGAWITLFDIAARSNTAGGSHSRASCQSSRQCLVAGGRLEDWDGLFDRLYTSGGSTGTRGNTSQRRCGGHRVYRFCALAVMAHQIFRALFQNGFRAVSSAPLKAPGSTLVTQRSGH